MKKHRLIWAAVFVACSASAQNVEFATPRDGDTVTSPFKVRFVVRNMAVAPAGEIKPGTGDQHKHFGKGQTETELSLPPGEHTLSLQFADGLHRSYGEAFRTTIRVKVN
jgi:hypothetical protein